MSVNRVDLLGRLGADVELKATKSGDSVANFTLATSEKYKDRNGEMVEKTTWHKIVVFGKRAEVCSKYLKKGSQIFLSGKISNRSWEAEDGTKKYVTEIIMSDMQFIGGGNKTEESSSSTDEIPF